LRSREGPAREDRGHAPWPGGLSLPSRFTPWFGRGPGKPFPKGFPRWDLGFEISLGFGFWDLGFTCRGSRRSSACPPGLRFFLPLPRKRAAGWRPRL
jgi:hypothetical protein